MKFVSGPINDTKSGREKLEKLLRGDIAPKSECKKCKRITLILESKQRIVKELEDRLSSKNNS